MPDINIQVAFQGGGAKLGTLLAAAKALYDGNGKDYQITRIAGTSAGAIAAAVLASGRDPSVFVARLREIAPKYLPKIVPSKYGFLMAYDVLMGRHIFNSAQYRLFLNDLFKIDGAQIVRISELGGVSDVFFYSTDIRTREPVVYNKSSSHLLVDALFDSSALPFIFRGANDETGIIDGGIINNFPSNILDKVEEFGQVVGFTFPKSEFRMLNSSTKAFAGAIIETMLDNSVNLALSKLDPRNIHVIDTNTSTLQFEKALKDDLNADFGRYVRSTSQFLNDTVKRMRIERVGVSEVSALNRISSYYQAVTESDNIDVPSVKVTYRCNALKERDPARPDECQVELELSAKTKPARAFSLQMGVASNALHESADEIGITLMDDANKIVGTTVIPVRADISDSKVPAAKIIVLFHSDLEVGRTYRLSFAAPTSEVLYDLTAPQRTDFSRFSLNVVDSVEKLYIVAYVPRDIGEIELLDWNKPEGQETWKKGRSLTPAEVIRISYPPNGFYAIGWMAENLVKGNAAGFQALLR